MKPCFYTHNILYTLTVHQLYGDTLPVMTHQCTNTDLWLTFPLSIRNRFPYMKARVGTAVSHCSHPQILLDAVHQCERGIRRETKYSANAQKEHAHSPKKGSQARTWTDAWTAFLDSCISASAVTYFLSMRHFTMTKMTNLPCNISISIENL